MFMVFFLKSISSNVIAAISPKRAPVSKAISIPKSEFVSIWSYKYDCSLLKSVAERTVLSAPDLLTSEQYAVAWSLKVCVWFVLYS